jgi:hypothetical protein
MKNFTTVAILVSYRYDSFAKHDVTTSTGLPFSTHPLSGVADRDQYCKTL